MTLDKTFYGSPDRGVTMRTVMQLFRDTGGKTILETGCYRGIPADGQSTLHFGLLAEEVGGQHYAVQINPEHCAQAREATAGLTRTTIVEADSVLWLAGFNDKIDLLYLDSFDYEPDAPIRCQVHALAEMGACIGKMSPRSVVLLDDYNNGLDGGGKCPLVIQFLTQRGWRMLMSDYQILFGSP